MKTLSYVNGKPAYVNGKPAYSDPNNLLPCPECCDNFCSCLATWVYFCDSGHISYTWEGVAFQWDFGREGWAISYSVVRLIDAYKNKHAGDWVPCDGTVYFEPDCGACRLVGDPFYCDNPPEVCPEDTGTPPGPGQSVYLDLCCAPNIGVCVVDWTFDCPTESWNPVSSLLSQHILDGETPSIPRPGTWNKLSDCVFEHAVGTTLYIWIDSDPAPNCDEFPVGDNPDAAGQAFDFDTCCLDHPRALYYNSAVDNNWNTLGNWWIDVACTKPAYKLPRNNDDVTILGAGVVDTGPAGFGGGVNNFGKIGGGTFNGAYVYSYHGSSISGGTFAGAVNNNGGTISGSGEFNGSVDNYGNGSINGVTFNGSINGGTFNGAVNNNANGSINGGTFNGAVDNDGGTISGSGEFNGSVDNHSTISGGTFNGAVNNNADGSISGGTFNTVSTVDNIGTISNGTFDGYVENCVNGVRGTITGGMFNGTKHDCP